MTTTMFSDTSLVLTRELRPLVRDPFSVIFTMVQPLVFLALFGPLLSGVTGLDTADALQWFVPGIIVMSALFGASMTGSNLLMEMQSGSHERMLVTPLHRSSLLVGRSLKEIVPVLVQAAVIVAVVIPFGFRFEAAGALLGILIVATFAVGLAGLSYSLAIATKGNDWIFWAVQQTLIFPLLLLAGMLLPIDDGPGWLEALSKLNPLTYIVDAERLLFAGDLAHWDVLWGALAAAGVLALGLTVGIRSVHAGAE
jgi:ABC-2 type transport system permease protein